MRIENHPILEFNRTKELRFTFNGKEMVGYDGETIAAALHANGVKILSHSLKEGRPRGFFCAIGNCSSCLMRVNGTPNVRVCTEPLKDGMVVEIQQGKGVLK